MDFAAIQDGIEELPKEQQVALAAWLAPGGAALLKQMKNDVRAGKFRSFEGGRPPKR